MVINLERFGRPRVAAITQVLTEQATDVGSLSLFRLDPSFGRTLYLADLRVVQLGRKLLQALNWVASGVAKTTANLPKHLTWFLASFNTPTDIPGIVDQVCHCRRYVRNQNALRIALDTDLAAGLRHPQRRHLPRLSSERPTTPLL